ncbi:MAG: DUF1624 domain-containing protein [Calditrichaeota bacterium]|nr:DUF1624 domain-containing protein [Calditrichota bacterium]
MSTVSNTNSEIERKKQEKRIVSLDFLKGIIMVLMSIDHVRFFYHIDARNFDPLDLTQTNPLLFMTRWITHFCAPLFIFLAGLSVFLMRQHRSKADVSKFLWTRGLFLILLELTLFRFCWNPNIFRPVFSLLVIWVIGITMIIMAAIQYLPKRYILGIGLSIMLGHNLMQSIVVPEQSWFYPFWVFFYAGGGIAVGNYYIYVLYSFFPYIGMICLGYSFAELYQADFSAQRRKQLLLQLGFASLLLFILLRITNLYGDPSSWNMQDGFVNSILAFINTTKYPLSLQFTLMTLGPAFLLLAFTENLSGKIASVFILFGKIPMFYYIMHLIFIPFSEYLLARIFTGKVQIQQFNLLVVYLALLIINSLLYFVCKRFLNYKSRHRDKNWLRYI